ncbi:hypothetical protein HK098_006936 [Nowakowskiella sp. JEL0407]|nr:hypothetical protein HK098_006926 [Nowakowskiella sp. JEL0407]KAJ3126978.1 hypothetical protein HK098_006936 [Nowakowskiella sp. JEL0407]
MTPAIGYFIVHEEFLFALQLLFVAGFTDFLDGYIARHYGMKTAIGSALDPAADKLLMATLTISLCGANILPVPLALIIVGRDVALILWSAIVRYQTLSPPVRIALKKINTVQSLKIV